MCRVSDDLDSQLRQTARLYYIHGLDQTEVASMVGVSRSQVSRLLSRARERGIVRISVDDYDPRNSALENELKALFHLNHAIVVRTADGASSESVRRATGFFAAPVVSEMIRSNAVVGVAGGRTVYEMVRHMAPTSGTRGVAVVQLMGNIGPSVSNVDAIELSHTLAQNFGGTFYTLNAPAYAADPQTREVFLRHQDVRSVWELFGVMQIAMVGIGSLTESSFIEQGVLGPSGIEQLRERGAVGEICGRFFDSRGHDCATDYQDRVISIELDELRHRQEVIGVVGDAGKTEAVYAACSSGLIKSLVIDEAGATAILAKAAGVMAAGV
jgi:DNA-binding transcriptional regulator LsrR (DeoR family)